MAAPSSVLGTLARRGVLQVKQLHGVSSGALCVATYLGVESGYTRMEDVYRCYQLFQRARWLSGEMRAFLDQCLPPDVHLRASGRAHITVTELAPHNWYVPTRRVIHDFPTRDDFLDAVFAPPSSPASWPRLHRPRGDRNLLARWPSCGCLAAGRCPTAPTQARAAHGDGAASLPAALDRTAPRR